MTSPETHTSELATSGHSIAITSTKNDKTSSRATRENAREKAKRLLVTGRLRVTKVQGNFILAECRGDSGEVYYLGHEEGAATPWRCTCPARTACSHLHALWAVTAVQR